METISQLIPFISMLLSVISGVLSYFLSQNNKQRIEDFQRINQQNEKLEKRISHVEIEQRNQMITFAKIEGKIDVLIEKINNIQASNQSK